MLPPSGSKLQELAAHSGTERGSQLLTEGGFALNHYLCVSPGRQQGRQSPQSGLVLSSQQ